ncbi:MAG: hypothetical protein ACRELZ_03440, partial [Candidatus Rokuibacteriota bacterium]
MFGPGRRKTDPLPARARHLVWLAPLALTALVGCATRNDLYVLLPGKDGKTGALTVESEGRKQTLDTPYAAARVKNVGSVDGVTSSAAAVKQDFGPALEAQPKRPVS